MHTFECLDPHDFQTRIVGETISTYTADTVVHLPQLTPIDLAVSQLSQSPEDLLIDPAEDRLLQSLDSSQTDSEDNSLDTSLPEVPMEMGPV